MSPEVSQNQTPPRAPQKEPAGPVVGAVIVVLLLIIGAFYFWNARFNQPTHQEKLPFITGDTATSENQ